VNPYNSDILDYVTYLGELI